MIIVTGAAGFIGSNIVADLQNTKYGQSVVACDYFGSGNKWKNIAKHFVSNFIHPSRLANFIVENHEIISHIIHMGAISSTTETDIDLLIKTNVNLTLSLWDLC